jgi:DNA-binding transcriptional regulator PaaX
VRMTLTRMVKAGALDAPERGFYQSMRFKPQSGK